MGFARIVQRFPDGNEFEILVDSDLDSLGEVTAEALALWQAALVDEA